MLRLAVMIEGNTQYLPLTEGVATLGSSKENDLVLHCDGVSRKHATVERRGEHITIRDAGSKNGLVVGGRRVHEVTLDPRTSVIIGRAIVRLDRVDTGDAEIAVLLDSLGSSSDVLLARMTETVSEGTDAARKFLRWMREAEQGTCTRGELLEDAREILGAMSLLIVRAGLVIQDVAGAWPSSEDLSELASDAPARWIADSADEEIRYCAFFPDGLPSSAWRRDLLSFFASKLDARAAQITDARGEELAFGDAIVQGTSPAMAAVYALVRQAVRSDLNVLLLGESGSGKEMIARLIHASDATRQGEFVAVNMTAIAASMPEAELFGVAEGAATNVQARPGAFRSAHRGTLLLDEIADTPMPLQGALLRAVEAHAVTPVGASIAVPVDVRIVSATNKDPRALRQDLFYRLSGMTITVPPLRERREDIPQLVTSLAAAAMQRFRKSVRGFTPNAMQMLVDYTWPGNVRELRNVIERAVLTCPARGAIETLHLDLQQTISPSLDQYAAAAEGDAIDDALRKTGGNVTRAAKLLNVSRQTVYNKLKKH